MPSPALEMVKQFKVIQDTLNENQKKQFDLIQQRGALVAIPCSTGDAVKRLKRMLEISNEKYQTHNQHKIQTLITGQEKDDYDLNNLMIDLTDDKKDFNFLLFLLQKPIYDNLENVVSQIFPPDTVTMSFDERRPKIEAFDKKIQKLKDEYDRLIDEVKEGGLVDVGFTYREVKADKPPMIERPPEPEVLMWFEHQQKQSLINTPNPPKEPPKKRAMEHNKNFFEEVNQELNDL